MSYATVMVHVGIDAASDARVQLASELADKFHAALIGIAGWGPRPPFVAEGVTIDTGPTQYELQVMAAELDKLATRFRSIAAKGRRQVEWRSEVDFPIEVVAREARAADLIVIGRDGRSADIFRSLDPGSAILKVGRPVLVVPTGLMSLAAKRIMIAWKDTREARRAVRDAIPFLHDAEKLFVLEVCQEGQEDSAQQHISGVTQYLSHHRIATSEGVMLHVRGSVTDELLRVVREQEIDLIVAGAYGHSRLGEWVFGGVTRDLLATSPVSCLLSH